MSGNTDMRKNQPRSDRGGGKHESFFHRLGKRLFAGFADELREEIRQDLQRETQELERSIEAWTWERYQRTEKLVENWTWERYQQTENAAAVSADAGCAYCGALQFELSVLRQFLPHRRGTIHRL